MPEITPRSDSPKQEAKIISTPAPVVEAPVIEKPNEDAQRFAQMARREKILREQSRKFQAEKQAFEAERAKGPTIDNSWKEKLNEDPVTFLAENGLTYDQLLQRMVNTNPLDPQVKILYKKLQELEEKQNGISAKAQQDQQTSYNAALKQIGRDVETLVKAQPEDFEAVAHAGKYAQNKIVELIELTYKEEGYVLDVEEATREVENYLVEEAFKSAQMKKVQAKLTPTQEAAKGEAQRAPATLSHSMTPPSSPLTSRERRERAILAFQGKLG